MKRAILPVATLAAALALAGCTGGATEATNVTSNSATLNATGGCSGGDSNAGGTPCTWYFEYDKVSGSSLSGAVPATGSDVVKTPVQGPVNENTSGNQALSADTGAALQPSTQYQYKICGEGDTVTSYSCAGTYANPGDQDGGNTPSTFTTASATTVSSTPDVPSSETPSGGWKVEYADAFAAPLGTGSGQDNTFFPNRGTAAGCVTQKGFNPKEMENFTCGQVSVDPRTGMTLTCSYGAPPNAIQYPGGSAINYDCGAAVSDGNLMPSGYDGIAWLDNYGNSSRAVVVEAKLQFPPNYSADPGWWGTGPYSPSPNDGDEHDWIEGWGWDSSSSACSDGSACALNWADQSITQPTVSVGGNGGQRYSTGASYGFDPSAAVHTYDVLYRANNTVQAYVDGGLLKWTSCNCTTFTANAHQPEFIDIILSYGMRGGFTNTDGIVVHDPVPTFDQSGQSHTMHIRSVAIYQNASADNAGMKQSNGSTTFPLIAPGTTVR